MSDKVLAAFGSLREQLGQAVIGQPAVIEALLVALLADGHVPLEGLPGLAKTRAVKALGRALQVRLARVQFTPDLLPWDLTGAAIYHQDGPADARFVFQPGPIFGPSRVSGPRSPPPCVGAVPPCGVRFAVCDVATAPRDAAMHCRRCTPGSPVRRRPNRSSIARGAPWR